MNHRRFLQSISDFFQTLITGVCVWCMRCVQPPSLLKNTCCLRCLLLRTFYRCYIYLIIRNDITKTLTDIVMHSVMTWQWVLVIIVLYANNAEFSKGIESNIEAYIVRRFVQRYLFYETITGLKSSFPNIYNYQRKK